MDIRVIRRHNLLHLVREAGGQKRLAERTGVSAAYLSQVLSRKVNRHVGHSLARRLESGMEKPYGWMDVLPPGVQPAAALSGAVREVDGVVRRYGLARDEGARFDGVLALAAEAGGAEALARRARVHAPYLLGLMDGGAAGAVPDDLARRLEAAMGKRSGWLDRPYAGGPAA
jgi:hypothetical protein